MSSLLYLFAFVLIVSWTIFYFIMEVGGFIHLLPVIAIIAVLLRIVASRILVR